MKKHEYSKEHSIKQMPEMHYSTNTIYSLLVNRLSSQLSFEDWDNIFTNTTVNLHCISFQLLSKTKELLTDDIY